ncbi:MAG: TIGR03013 family PEP-CTERM/XrtA system glycosyltransferase [Planctomycetes bacterium]|nr:TIGR03013 family PEP-CTERM/XrtA system glycosyltransferase [Planctomycetota bacterium]
MLRVLRHTLPLRKALLILSETLILWVTVALGGTAHLFTPSDQLFRALAEEGYSLSSEAGLVCWISAFFVAVLCQLAITFNELYDFRVSVSKYDRAQRFVGSMGSALGLSLVAVVLAHAWGLQPILDFPGLSLARTVQMLVFMLLVGFAVLYSWRSLFHLMLQRADLNQRVLILGSGKAAHVLAKEMRQHAASGYEIAGLIPERVSSEPGLAFDPSETQTGDLVWSKYSVGEDGVTEEHESGEVEAISLLELCRAKRIDGLVVALADRRKKLPTNALLDCRLAGLRVEDYEGIFERVTGKIAVEALRPSYLIFNEGFSRNRIGEISKRTVDFVLALVGIVVTFVPMILTAIAVRRDSPGPVLFTQERVGADGRPFTLFKFRSMRADAEKHTGPVWAQEDDPRITKVGKFIRKTRLDELPQLFNVLTGDMSLVGPRPERPHFVDELAERIPYFRQRHIVKPGVTGWAQINYPYGNTIEDALQKLQYDLFYIKYQSVLFDLSIVFNTVKTVLLRKGT